MKPGKVNYIGSFELRGHQRPQFSHCGINKFDPRREVVLWSRIGSIA
jgi:hypothetical protein